MIVPVVVLLALVQCSSTLAKFTLGGQEFESSEDIVKSGRVCGTKQLTQEELTRYEEEFVDAYSKQEVDIDERMLSGIPIGGVPQRMNPHTIDVYWHVLQSSAENVLVSDEVIASQLTVLNAGYASALFQFNTIAIERIIDADLAATIAYGYEADQSIMKTLHNVDIGAYVLNIYVVNIQGGAFGWATYPRDYRFKPNEDGVVMHYELFPGVLENPYDLGHMLIHQVGHWLGLYHPFEGGKCSRNAVGGGDLIPDTPASMEPTFGCSESLLSKDTCPLIDGKDPINNYMDFSDDDCTNQFTFYQILRMHRQWNVFRDKKPFKLVG